MRKTERLASVGAAASLPYYTEFVSQEPNIYATRQSIKIPLRPQKSCDCCGHGVERLARFVEPGGACSDCCAVCYRLVAGLPPIAPAGRGSRNRTAVIRA